jgi:pimeloyl-ACP methyl ester carboxylesterase
MLHSVRRGQGPPLVLLAGIGMAGAAWDPVADRLARERQLWAVDLPGFGRSVALAEGAPCGVEALADSVQASLLSAGLERAHVAGNSLGGAVALELGRRDAVASVTALSPVGFAGAAGQEFARRSLLLTHRVARALHGRGARTFARPGVRRLLCGQMFAHPERLTPDEAYANLTTLVEGAGFHAVLDGLGDLRFAGPVPVPVMVAWGTRDRLLLPYQALRARRVLPEARHVWLHGCGHVPMSDDPEQVAGVLLAGSAVGDSARGGGAGLCAGRVRVG